jgi:hypothetical protein
MPDKIRQVKVNNTTYDIEPAASSVLQIDNAAPTLAWGATSTVATVDGVDITVKMPANPNSDTKVTAVGNHYAPTADTSAKLTATASSTTAATWGSTDMVTGVTLNRDAKGHVTGLSVSSIQMPPNPNTNTDTKVTQSESTSTNVRTILLHKNTGADPGTVTDQVYYAQNVTIQPSTGRLSVPSIVTTGTINPKGGLTGKLTVGGKTYTGAANVEITAADLGLGSALRFIGVTETALTDGANTNPILINGSNYTAVTGDVVMYLDKEFVWIGTVWEELGDASSHSKVGHTHSVSLTAVASTSGTTTVATGSVSSSGGGSTVATGASGSAKGGSETHTHSYTKPTGVSLGSNTTATNGIKYVEAVSHTAAAASSTAKFGSETHTHTYDKTTGVTLTANSSTATGRITYLESLSAGSGSLTSDTTATNGIKYIETQGTLSQGSLPSLTVTSKSPSKISAWSAGTMFKASVSGTTLELTSGAAPSLTYAAEPVGSASGWSAGSLPSLGAATTKYLHHTHNIPSGTTKYLSAAPSNTSTASGAPSATASAITAISGGGVTPTTKYFHPSITTESAATGGPSATTSFVTGVSTSKLATTTVDKKGHTHAVSGTTGASTN